MDHSKFNEKTIKYVYPKPRFSLPLEMDYLFKIAMKHTDRKRTTFSSPSYEHYQFIAMPIRPYNVVSTFQRMIEKEVCRLHWIIAVLNLDVILFVGNLLMSIQCYPIYNQLQFNIGIVVISL